MRKIFLQLIHISKTWEVFTMKYNIPWIIFIVSLLTFTPFKIYSSIAETGLEKSVVFSVILLVISLIFLGSVFFSKGKIINFYSSKNPYIGITSIILSISFLWNALTYIFCETSNSSFIQTLLMLILAIASSVTFVFIALNYFLGKNMFKSAQILVFFPVLWFTIKMVSFLSISENNPNPYDVALSSTMLLFLLYHTQIFVTATDKNMTNKLFIFGMPAVVCSLMYCIPEIVNQMRNTELFNQNHLSIIVTQLILGIYTCFILIDLQKQINLNNQ